MSVIQVKHHQKANSNSTTMFLGVQVERALSAKRSDAITILTNEFLDSRVHHEKVIDHLFMVTTIDATNEAQSLSFVTFDVR